MSRVRLGLALAFCGILITTGGCSNSATAPEAASYDFAADRFSNPATADDNAVNPARPNLPAPGGEEIYTTTSTGWMLGGGRVDN